MIVPRRAAGVLWALLQCATNATNATDATNATNATNASSATVTRARVQLDS